MTRELRQLLSIRPGEPRGLEFPDPPGAAFGAQLTLLRTHGGVTSTGVEKAIDPHVFAKHVRDCWANNQR